MVSRCKHGRFEATDFHSMRLQFSVARQQAVQQNVPHYNSDFFTEDTEIHQNSENLALK